MNIKDLKPGVLCCCVGRTTEVYDGALHDDSSPYDDTPCTWTIMAEGEVFTILSTKLIPPNLGTNHTGEKVLDVRILSPNHFGWITLGVNEFNDIDEEDGLHSGIRLVTKEADEEK